MKRFLHSIVLLFLTIALSAQTFTTTDGIHLMRNGKPYRFIGTNFWYGPILASTGQGGNRARLTAELDSLQALGIDNLRVLIGSDGKRGMKTKVEPTLQIAPGVYNDTILDGLDYFMAELQRRDMQATLYFNNSWEWSGGYGYYLEQAGESKAPMSADVSWGDYCEYYSHFSTNRKAQLLFLDYVKFIVGRTNRYTGKPYTEDPSIFSWQIGNEPRAFSKVAKQPFAKWIKETASLIRSLDSNHMISLGSEGLYGCEVDMDLYRNICADKNIDFLNAHIWPSNWGWSTFQTVKKDLQNSKNKTLDYINQHIDVAQELNKPLVIEEFGYPRDEGSKKVSATTSCRDDYYNLIFSQVLKAANEDSPLAGVNFWGWAGKGKPSHEQWQVGDDYTCDPAHEPQGMYSVFDSDKSTINTIRCAQKQLQDINTNSKLSWRGIMIDVSRHFMPIEYLYKEVDAMAHFGLNKLHLHLTDAAGWRMEIKSRPRLTTIGAWRTKPTLDEWWNSDRAYSDSINGFGGYYTQQQLRDLVSYASQYGIEIVPEIEFPAHSEEVVAAYPEVGFNHAEMDMSKPETYQYMRDVLEEVASVFPSEYLHVGGDEAATQNNLQPEGMRRVKQIVDSLGRKMIAWDEALTPEPNDSDIIIMVWRNSSTALEAARLGHKVILCPGKYCYLDKAQDSPLKEPRAAGGYLPIDSVYMMPDPFADTPYANKLLGLQANVWTEHIPTPQHAEYMLWPRAYAIAQLGKIGLDAPRDLKTFHGNALKATDYLRNTLNINAFNLHNEIGERKVESATQSLPFSVTYNTQPHKAYPGSGPTCLGDKLFGGWNNNTSLWQGFLGSKGMDITIDLGSMQKFTTISGDFMQSCGPDIFFPYTIQISISKNGTDFKPLATLDFSSIYGIQQEDYQALNWQGKTKARYIRLQALPGPRRGWVFCSEITIR